MGKDSGRTETPWWALRFEAMADIDPGFVGQIDEAAEAEVEFLQRLLELGAGEKILDVGCGSGRHAVLLHEAGHAVTGVDLSPQVLRIAREAWEDRNPNKRGPQWMPGDMRWLKLPTHYDAAILMNHTFGMFEDDAEHLRALSSLADVLRPGGRIAMQLWNPYYQAANPSTRFAPQGTIADDLDVIRSTRFDAMRGRVEERMVAFCEGERHELPTLSVRAWTPPELIALLQGAGFGKVKVYGSEGWDVPEELIPVHPTDSVWLWVTATL